MLKNIFSKFQNPRISSAGNSENTGIAAQGNTQQQTTDSEETRGVDTGEANQG